MPKRFIGRNTVVDHQHQRHQETSEEREMTEIIQYEPASAGKPFPHAIERESGRGGNSERYRGRKPPFDKYEFQ